MTGVKPGLYTSLFSVALGLYFGLWALSAGSGYGMSHALNLLLFVSVSFIALGASAAKLVKSWRLHKKMRVFCVASICLSSLYVISFFKGDFDSVSLVKAMLWLMPAMVALSLWNLGLHYRLMVKVWFYFGLLINFLITFLIARFDPNIGKFYANVDGFEISSNTLSVYLIFSLVLPGLLLFKGALSRAVFLLLPLIHFSKSHVFIYVFSFFFGSCYARRRLVMFVIVVCVLLTGLVVLGALASELKSGIPSYLERPLGKLLLACEFLYQFLFFGEVPNFDFLITSVGDGLRASIYESAAANLGMAWPLGATENEIDSVFYGYDFHNVLLFLYYQAGVFGVFSYLMMLMHPMFVCKKVERNLRFLISMTCAYFLVRGLFISIDPVRIAVLLTTLTYFCLYKETAYER